MAEKAQEGITKTATKGAKMLQIMTYPSLVDLFLESIKFAQKTKERNKVGKKGRKSRDKTISILAHQSKFHHIFFEFNLHPSMKGAPLSLSPQTSS